MASLTDAEIVAKLMVGVRQATGFSDSRLSKERQTVMRYREGDLPGKLHAGSSSYVSMDVYAAHESLKAQLLEVFAGNLQPVTFTPIGENDVDLARVATDYVSYCVSHQNDGFGTMRDVIDDALLGRAGVAKVWWESRDDTVSYEMTETTLAAVMAHVQQNPDAEIKTLDIAEDEHKTVKRVEFSSKKDLSQVRIMPLPPEEWLIAPRSTSIETTELCGHRYRRSLSELVKDGYDKDVLAELADNDSVWLATEPELMERHQQTDDILTESILNFGQDASRTTTVYELYALLDPEDTGKSELYQCIIAGEKMLSKRPVSRRPFVAFVPLPRAHAFWGDNYDKLVIPLQNARTALTRSIIDHALITTNPRYMVVRNGLANPRELMESRIGGIVNVARPDAVTPLPQAGLNPFVYQTIELLATDTEQRTGVSRLSQGLSKDAVSKQNSQELINDQVGLSQVRQKVVARNFAEGFLRSLYLMVYDLVVENEAAQKIIQIAGEWTPIDPTDWPDRDHLTVTFTLGYGEQEKEAKKLVEIDHYLSQDPGLAHLYSPSNRYNVIKLALEAKGIKNVVSIIGTPQAAQQPPPPNPMQQAELAVKTADAAVKNANAQAAVEKLKLDQMKAQHNYEIEMARLKLEAMKETNKVQAEKDKLAHKVAVDGFEMSLQAKIAAEAPKESEASVAAPTRG